jgi:hypothetical protein
VILDYKKAVHEKNVEKNKKGVAGFDWYTPFFNVIYLPFL